MPSEFRFSDLSLQRPDGTKVDGDTFAAALNIELRKKESGEVAALCATAAAALAVFDGMSAELFFQWMIHMYMGAKQQAEAKPPRAPLVVVANRMPEGEPDDD